MARLAVGLLALTLALSPSLAAGQLPPCSIAICSSATPRSRARSSPPTAASSPSSSRRRDAERLGEGPGRAVHRGAARHRRTRGGRSRTTSGARQQVRPVRAGQGGDENFNVYAVDPGRGRPRRPDVPARAQPHRRQGRAGLHLLAAQDGPRPDLRRPERSRSGLARPLPGDDLDRRAHARSARTPRRSPAGCSTRPATLRLAERVADNGDTRGAARRRRRLHEGLLVQRLRELRRGALPQGRHPRLHGDQQGRCGPDRAWCCFDPATGKEEARGVRSAEEGRLRQGDLLGGHRRARRDDLRGRAHALLLPRQGATRPTIKALEKKLPGKRGRHRRRRRRTSSSGWWPRTADTEPGATLPLRPQDQEADAAVPHLRGAAARGAVADDRDQLPVVRRAVDPRLPDAAQGRAGEEAAAGRAAARRTVGARQLGLSSASRSSWPTAATPCCSRTSAARPATARSSSTPATSSGAARCRTTSPRASSSWSPRASPIRSASASWAARTAATRPWPGSRSRPDLYAAAVSIVGPSNLITLLDSIPPYWEAGRKIFYERMGRPDDAGGQGAAAAAVAARLAPARSGRRCSSRRAPTIRGSRRRSRIRS